MQGLASIFTTGSEKHETQEENKEDSDSSSMDGPAVAPGRWPTGKKGDKRRSRVYNTASWMMGRTNSKESSKETGGDVEEGSSPRKDEKSKSQEESRTSGSKEKSEELSKRPGEKGSSALHLDLTTCRNDVQKEHHRHRKKGPKGGKDSVLAPILSCRESSDQISFPKGLDPPAVEEKKATKRKKVGCDEKRISKVRSSQSSESLVASLKTSFPECLEPRRKIHRLAGGANELPYLIHVTFVGAPASGKSSLCSEYFGGAPPTPRVLGRIHHKSVEIYGKDFSLMIDDVGEKTTHEEFEKTYVSAWATVDVLAIGMNDRAVSVTSFRYGAIPRAVEAALKEGTPVIVAIIKQEPKKRKGTADASAIQEPSGIRAAEETFRKFLTEQWGAKARDLRFSVVEATLGERGEVAKVFSLAFSCFVQNHVRKRACFCNECILFSGPCLLNDDVGGFIASTGGRNRVAPIGEGTETGSSLSEKKKRKERERKAREEPPLAEAARVPDCSKSESEDEYTSGGNSESIEDFCSLCGYVNAALDNFFSNDGSAIAGGE